MNKTLRTFILVIGVTGIFLLALVFLGLGDLLVGDSRLFALLNPGAGHSTLVDTFFTYFTAWGPGYLGAGTYSLIGVILVQAALSYRFKTLRYLVLLAGLGAHIFIGVDFLLQYLIVRVRPFLDITVSSNTLMLFPNAAEIFTNSSFPSFHAGLTFAILSPFILHRGWWGKGLALGYGILTAYSRVFIGVHFPTDVWAGALIGFLIILLLYPLFEKRYFPRNPALKMVTKRLLMELERLRE